MLVDVQGYARRCRLQAAREREKSERKKRRQTSCRFRPAIVIALSRGGVSSIVAGKTEHSILSTHLDRREASRSKSRYRKRKECNGPGRRSEPHSPPRSAGCKCLKMPPNLTPNNLLLFLWP